MDSFTKRLIGAAIVVACAVGTGIGSRGVLKPAPEISQPFRVKGTGPVTIVEFSDFQCPACQAAEEPLRKLLELYPNDIRLVFKHFPLEFIHEWARSAAISAECAGKQGKFWEYHHLLYDKQREWSNPKARELLDEYAKSLKLDMTQFAACKADAAVSEAVTADAMEARSRWVNSTPTFFVNGKRLVGARQLAQRAPAIIEKAVKK